MSADKNLTLQSPRLQTLYAQWQAGDTAVLDQFWQEMASETTPLVERIAEQPDQCWVTFLWRDPNRELKSACVTEGPAGFDFHLGQMARLADTDIWYRTYRLPSDTVMLYHLSPNNPMPVWGSPEWADVWDEFEPEHFQFDPLNPLRHADGSVLRLPDAPAEPWFESLSDEKTGRLDIHDLEENSLGSLRRARVYTPANYVANGRSYPWRLLFDGATYADAVATTMLDNLIDQGVIPPMVVVFVNGSWQDRRSDYGCNPKFNHFLVEELRPFLHQTYHLSSDPADVGVGGYSLGGLGALFATIEHPEVFGNVLAQGGFFQWSPDMQLHGLAEDTCSPQSYAWLVQQCAIRDKLPLRIHLDVGRYDFNGQPELHSNTLMVNRHLRDVLIAKGYDLNYVEFNGGHDFVGWRTQLPAALSWLWKTQ